jgi:integrase
MRSPREVASVIEAYTPLGVASEAAVFARQVVARAGPASATRAKAWLFAASRIGAFAASIGLELDPAVVLSTAVIERFVISIEASVSHPTRRTVRSNLRCLAAAISAGPSPVGLPREHAKKPYTWAEIAAYLALADAQPTLTRRMKATGLICLGAGAGLVGADLRAVRGVDVMSRSGGLVVSVAAGRRPRVVPVLCAYHDRLIAVAQFFAGRIIVGGVEASRRNITTPLISSLSGGADLPRLEIGRLRSTWLAAVAEAIGLRAFMDAAGVVCSQRLGDIAAAVAPVDEETAVRLLGGRP